MKLLLVRDGESVAKASGILSSHPGDGVVLTKSGIMQAEQLSFELPKSLSAVYASPLERAIETAEIALGRDAEIIIEPRIKEVDYGECSGQSNNAELDSVRQMQVRGDYNVRFGVNGENRLDVLNR